MCAVDWQTVPQWELEIHFSPFSDSVNFLFLPFVYTFISFPATYCSLVKVSRANASALAFPVTVSQERAAGETPLYSQLGT